MMLNGYLEGLCNMFGYNVQVLDFLYVRSLQFRLLVCQTDPGEQRRCQKRLNPVDKTEKRTYFLLSVP